MIIREVEGPSLDDLTARSRPESAFVADHFPGLTMVGSGKGALSLVLRFLAQQRVLENKNSEVLVNRWMGTWVYSQIQMHAFPVTRPSPETRVMVVYHQYGFPQDMDAILAFAREKKLMVIEDCAHTLLSSYRGRPLGTLGDFAIYSFSKFLFCYALGAIRTHQAGFDAFARQELAAASPLQTTFKDLAKFAAEFSASVGNPALVAASSPLLVMSYALYSSSLRPGPAAISLFHAKVEREIAVRRERYRHFRQRVDHLGVCDHLEPAGVVPYVIPIKGSVEQLQATVEGFRQLGVASGVYRFDMNRNLLRPRFEPVAWVPCHSRLDDALFERLIDVVRRVHA